MKGNTTGVALLSKTSTLPCDLLANRPLVHSTRMALKRQNNYLNKINFILHAAN